eukprot:g8890.t1
MATRARSGGFRSKDRIPPPKGSWEAGWRGPPDAEQMAADPAILVLREVATTLHTAAQTTSLRGLLGEYYELDYDAEDLPCNLDSLEDAFLGQVPHVQTTESDGLEIEKLTPANWLAINCKWNLVERTDRYPEVFYPTIENARVDLGFKRDVRDEKYYIDFILYPKEQPPGSPLRDEVGYASNAYLRLGYRLLEVNGDDSEFIWVTTRMTIDVQMGAISDNTYNGQAIFSDINFIPNSLTLMAADVFSDSLTLLRPEILSKNVFLAGTPIRMKFQAFKLEYFCSGVITFQANFFGTLQGALEIRNPGRYDFRLYSSVNFIMGHDHCAGGDVWGYNDGACGPRSAIQNLKMSSLTRHMSGAIGTECMAPGSDTTVCQDKAYQSRVPAGDICFNTANGCEPFSVWAMQLPDAKCDAQSNDGKITAARTLERHRWMRAGFHPLRVNIARRFMSNNFDTYKGPDTTPIKTVRGVVMVNCTGADQDYFSVQSSAYNFASADGQFKYKFENGHWSLINVRGVDKKKCPNRGTALNDGEDGHLMFKYRWAGYSPGAELYDFPWRQDVRDVEGNLISRDLELGENMAFVNTPENMRDVSLPELSVFHGYQWVTVPGNAYLPLWEKKWQADWWGPIEREYEFVFPNYVFNPRSQERRTQTFGEKLWNQHVTVARGLGRRRLVGEDLSVSKTARELFWKRLGLLERKKDAVRERICLKADSKGTSMLWSSEEELWETAKRTSEEQREIAAAEEQRSLTPEQFRAVFDGLTGGSSAKNAANSKRQNRGGPVDPLKLDRFTEEEWAAYKANDRRIAERQQREFEKEKEARSRTVAGADPLAIVITNPPSWKTMAPTTTTTTTAAAVRTTTTTTTTTVIPGSVPPKYVGRSYHEVLFFVTPNHPEVTLDGKPMVRPSNWPNEFPWSRDSGTDVSDPVPLVGFDYTQPFAARFTGVVNFERRGNYT